MAAHPLSLASHGQSSIPDPMTDEPYILITADTHAGGSHAQYREYLDPQWRDAFDEWRGGYVRRRRRSTWRPRNYATGT